ncbi:MULTISPECIES: HK97-gp10 family putative phage morphogenesis protein [unclassified Novosphingobium]|uniref:HK97-gp10 family putative phage morphogenesis protein n=1 Tax=unclassified Novosphingobium TaxID=2644732 RepID=UPI0009E9B8B4|nr:MULTISPECIES: HK97-gp10 family putative phage morphogenesis protein [unclassified Novosphingobium]WRT91916.1 HK97-gp10 family putative phage morphogenesis protein [Novosphingobium sp. RL4]
MPKSRLIGAKAHANRLKKLSGEKMVREVGKALFAAGEMIQVEAQISITAGAVSGKKHVPSAPGQAPNNDTGTLAGNIETNQTAPLVVEVSSNAPYAGDLEFGTSKMAARPYMAPARDAKRKEVEQLVRRAVDNVVRQSKSGDS